MARSSKERAEGDKPARSLAFRMAKGALVALVTAGVGFGVVYGLDALRADVRAAPTHQMSAASLRLVKGPPWMTPAILGELDVALLDPEFPQRFSLLDEGVSRRIAAAYERCVWVERVQRIVKHDPRVDATVPPLEVHLKFRRPMAFVKSPEGYCLVDDKGVRLPGVYAQPRLGAMELMVVTGVTSRVPNVGQPWRDPSVEGAVRVAEAVGSKREAFRLVSVDVSNYGGRRDPRDSEVALFTANNTRIKWGRAPTREAAMLQEKTLDQKVAYLDYVYQRLEGQVDGVLAYIDIPNEAVRRRSASSSTQLRS